MPDVTLRLDVEGVIRDVSLANSVSGEGVADWIGRPWGETSGDAAGAGILRMLSEARANGVSYFRQVTQRFPSGLELPMEYNAVLLGQDTGLVAVGRNLLAVAGVQSGLIADQTAREQHSWKLRSLETRFRLLFDASDEPMLQLSADDLLITDANPAAVRAGALDAGRDFVAAVAQSDRDALRLMVRRVAEQGRAPRILLHIGPDETPWLVRASLSSDSQEPGFLLQLSSFEPRRPAAPEIASLDTLMDRLPDSFVLVDAAGLVVRANRAFLDLVQAGALGAVVGHSLERWLQLPGADAAVLLANIRRHRVIRGFLTTLQGELGSEIDVEISAAGDSDARPVHIGLLMRDISRRPVSDTSSTPAGSGYGDRLLGPLVKLADQIGQTPLLQLVRDTGSLIERHYIEDALGRVNGNRTAAAELLGVSRQSLYAKLTRHGMGTHAEDKATGA